jgi:hypothetical protein
MNNVGGMAVESNNVFGLEVKPHFTSRVRLQFSEFSECFSLRNLRIIVDIFILRVLKVLQMRNN